MLKLSQRLDLERCPHCAVSRPSLVQITEASTNSHLGDNPRFWRVYRCEGCGGLVTASAVQPNTWVKEYFPKTEEVEDNIPPKAREYLRQAMGSLAVPAGAVMLSASAVDALLKAKGLIEGSLYSRIDLAAEQRIITPAMAQWAHQVRLEANNQRHSDVESDLPTEREALQSLEFTKSLAQFMFVLPARVDQGLSESQEAVEAPSEEVTIDS